MFLDAHLFENIDLYLKISEQFGEILAGIRNYPYPALVYKIVLHKYIHGTSGSIVAPVISQPIINTPVQKEPQEQRITAPVQTVKNPVTVENDLWSRVIARIDKDSLQKSLKDLSSISSLENGVAHIMVINKFAQMAFENHDNRDYIEKLLSEEYGSPLQIKIEFQSKEDFFSGMLG